MTCIYPLIFQYLCKMIRYLFIYLCLFYACLGLSQAQSKKEQRLADREKRREARALIDQEAHQAAVQALLDSNFVLTANYVYNQWGYGTPVTNNLNFISINKNTANLQLAFNGVLSGPNNLGGITVQGTITSYQVSINKKNNSAQCVFNVFGPVFNARVVVNLYGSSNNADASVDPNTSGRNLTFMGNIVPYNQAQIFEGTPRY